MCSMKVLRPNIGSRTGGDEHVGKDEESEDEDNYSGGIEVD